MANSQAGNVIYVDTTAAFDVRSVYAVKYFGSNNGTAVISSTASGLPLWEEGGSDFSKPIEEICIHDAGGLTVTVANGAVVYLYLGGG